MCTPEPSGSHPRDLGDVVLAMALEAARLQAPFSGTGGPDGELLAALVRADRYGDLSALWRLAVPGVCAAYRVGARTAAEAAGGGDPARTAVAASTAVLAAGR